MEILTKDVELNEILSCYDRENGGSESFDYGRGLLAQADRDICGGWARVLLSKEDVLRIILPYHRHPAENPNVIVIPPLGMAVSVAAGRVKDITRETGPCWENIHFHKGRNFSEVHIFLRHQGGGYMNLDGLHRLLAWVIFEKVEEIPAYVIGLPP